MQDELEFKKCRDRALAVHIHVNKQHVRKVFKL